MRLWSLRDLRWEKKGGAGGAPLPRGVWLKVSDVLDRYRTDDQLGEAVPLKPEWAKEYDVRPDDQARDVKVHRHGRERARKAYRQGPTAPIPYLPDGLELDTGEPSRIDELVGVHKERLREGVAEQWRHLAAIEQNIGEVAVDFDSEDPAIPEMRLVLDHCREELTDLHEETQGYTGPFELEEPGEEELAWVRELMEREPP